MKPTRRTATPPGFTLVELLVVMAILGLVLSLALPGLAQARRGGQRSGCLNNLRQIGLAAGLHADDKGAYPAAWIDAQTRWMDLLKPYLEKGDRVYLCPADGKRLAVSWDPTIFLSYGINTFRFGDKDACFWYGVKPQRVARPAATILYADCTPGKYYCGGGTSFSEPVVDADCRHPERAFVAAFCDGHVEARKTTTQSDWDASR